MMRSANLHQDVDATGDLHRRCGHDHGEGDAKHFAGDGFRSDPKSGHENEQTDRAPQAQADPPRALA
jgi:hypothetical protein